MSMRIASCVVVVLVGGGSGGKRAGGGGKQGTSTLGTFYVICNVLIALLSFNRLVGFLPTSIDAPPSFTARAGSTTERRAPN